MSKKQHFKTLRMPSVNSYQKGKLKNACIALFSTRDSSQRFYEIYQLIRKGAKGTTGDRDQDLLRAMLVFACSGLDAVIKQLVRDTLEYIVFSDIGAQQEFRKYVERKLKRELVDVNISKERMMLDTNFLASIVISDKPKEMLINDLKKTITNNSLQSKDQLLRTASYFAITKNEILKDEEITEKAFNVRNEIIHEIDVNFNIARRKNKRQRKVKEMVNFSENILSIAALFIKGVVKKLKNARK